MFKTLKKLLFKQSNEVEGLEPAKKKIPLIDKYHKLHDFAVGGFNDIVSNVKIIREKLQHLEEVNYKLGLKHLENGNLSDAIFRFKFVKKFWPHNKDAIYQLGYCLVLKQKFSEAIAVLDELARNDPSYKEKCDRLLEKATKLTAAE